MMRLQLNIFMAKAVGFASIVKEEDIFENAKFQKHKEEIERLSKELNDFVLKYKKDDKELVELSETIGKKSKALKMKMRFWPLFAGKGRCLVWA